MINLIFNKSLWYLNINYNILYVNVLFIGIANTVGRIASGFLADLKNVDALVINNVALVISGISLFLQPLCVTYELLIVFSVVYGLCVCK